MFFVDRSFIINYMPTTVEQLEPAQREKIVKLLQLHRVGVLATVTADGDPHASTIYVNADDNLNVSFSTKRETRKYENIARHNTVMIVVYDPSGQVAVQLSGKAVEVHDAEEQMKIYSANLKAAEQTGPDVVPPLAKIPAGQYVAFRVEIENIWLSDYGWGDNFATAMQHAQDPAPNGDPS